MDEREEIAEAIRSGQYFKEARAWYQAIYISPVSGRTMFMVIAVCAVLVALVAVAAVSSLLPISTNVPVLMMAPEKIDDVDLRAVPLNRPKREINQAMQEFFCAQFVRSYESWNPKTLQQQQLIINAHSNEKISNQYVSTVGQQIQENKYTEKSTREIQVISVNLISSPQGNSAIVKFKTTLKDGNPPYESSMWTAKLKYSYTPLQVAENNDTSKRASSLAVTDPTFQVTEYAVENR